MKIEVVTPKELNVLKVELEGNIRDTQRLLSRLSDLEKRIEKVRRTVMDIKENTDINIKQIRCLSEWMDKLDKQIKNIESEGKPHSQNTVDNLGFTLNEKK